MVADIAPDDSSHGYGFHRLINSLREVPLEQVENRETLRPALAALSERERAVLLLRFFESQTQTQIAERIGVSQMHVSRLLAKSLQKLRDELDRGPGGPAA